MQTLFERETRPVDTTSALGRNCTAQGGDVDSAFAQLLLQGTLSHEEDIRAAVQKHAPGWSLERMDPVSRCTLFLGCFELLYSNDAPPAVVMNEAIEIAKEFGTPESGKFVNGVLNAIAHGEGKEAL